MLGKIGNKLKKKFWKNKKVLVVGHTGFKGGWLTMILNLLGAKVYGIALNPETKPNFFNLVNLKKYLIKDLRINIENYDRLNKEIKKIKPSIIFHLAAQSKVRDSYTSSLNTIKTNVLGTANILEIFRNNSFINSLLITTTDKVYKNKNNKRSFTEIDELGGDDIYSASKSSIEIIANSYNESFFNKSRKQSIICLRAGNVIGGGDWTKDRIVKDCAESFIKNKPIKIRSPGASRPWQHVLEPLFGYLKLAEKLYTNKKFVGSWNFGPNFKNNLKVLDVAKFGIKVLKSKSKISFNKPKYYESEHLSLDNKKSFKYLKWKTFLKPKDALKLAFDWYKFYYDNIDNKKLVVKFTFLQIKEYTKKFF